MSHIPTVKARNEFADILNRAAYGKERVVLTRRGKSLVAVVPIEDLELIESLEDRLDLDDAREALKKVGKQKTVSWNKLKRDLGL